ncbi:hypothetical protein HK100_008140 [Physocladia obscura]|uniref:Uncharacterized protein n=1 Tax=Physocladia obscura TaxID=109957 RepID=A0AAD5T4G3_9FUNG|nr:hypothetical protein HK100_008140 [Physocladia obscura]
MSFLFSQAHANTQRRKEKALDTHAHSTLLHASPVDAVARGLLVGAPVGALYGASKAWWFEYPPRAGYALLARQAGLIAGIAAVYAGTNSLVAHARNKDDVWNAPYAGFASGFVYGMRCMFLPFFDQQQKSRFNLINRKLSRHASTNLVYFILSASDVTRISRVFYSTFYRSMATHDFTISIVIVIAIISLAGSIKKTVFFSSVFAGLALYGKFFADQYNENLSRTPFEKRDAHPPIFIGNPRDQYKTRWEAIKEREAAAAESDE